MKGFLLRLSWFMLGFRVAQLTPSCPDLVSATSLERSRI
jgi:hypothetical protein